MTRAAIHPVTILICIEFERLEDMLPSKPHNLLQFMGRLLIDKDGKLAAPVFGHWLREKRL